MLKLLVLNPNPLHASWLHEAHERHGWNIYLFVCLFIIYFLQGMVGMVPKYSGVILYHYLVWLLFEDPSLHTCWFSVETVVYLYIHAYVRYTLCILVPPAAGMHDTGIAATSSVFTFLKCNMIATQGLVPLCFFLSMQSFLINLPTPNPGLSLLVINTCESA